MNKETEMKKENAMNQNVTDLKEEHDSLTEFVQQFDEEEQDILMRMFAILDQRPRTKQGAEELEALGFKFRFLGAEKSDDPTEKATFVASEVAFNAAKKNAEEAGLSSLAVHIAGISAWLKVRGETPAEAEEYFEDVFLGAPSATRLGPITRSEIRATVDEIKQAGLWPWKGSGIE